MAFPRLSASLLLASWILLLYWTTSSAGSHDPTSSDLPPPYRVKRELSSETVTQVQQSLSVAKDVLSVVNTKIGSIDSKTVKNVMTGLSTLAGLVPGIGTLIVPMVNLVLTFIPQNNPVLDEVKKGFAEVNRKLDSLSNQISNLATDVEWFNYASVYSQDEVRILNAWKKFSELRDNSWSVKGEDKKLRQTVVDRFVNYYENTGTVASVSNFYHYLTVTNTSLSGNLNDLLRRKFKCDIRKIGDYNIHFSTLLWRGMLLNQFYWKLIGFDRLDKETKHTEMIKQVYTAQISAIDHCLDNYEKYVKEDVEEISNKLSQDDQTAFAVAVKSALDEKYYWYDWVVMVYTDKDSYHDLYNMVKIPVGTITVAVGYTQRAEEIHKSQVSRVLEKCYREENTHPMDLDREHPCEVIKEKQKCSSEMDGVPVTEFFRVMHASYPNTPVQVPEPLKTFKCKWGGGWNYFSHIFYSRNLPVCSDNTCENGGECKRVLDSSEHMCLCPDGYRRENCQEQEKLEDVPLIDQGTVPHITTINARLKKMEDKLNKMDDKLNRTDAKLELILQKLHCPAQ